MKVFDFCILVLLLGIDLPLLGLSDPDVAFLPDDDHMAISVTNRKLKGDRYQPRHSKGSDVDLEDYHPVDPAPSSKAKVKPGPIEHGTPLNPFIPRPSPPGHPEISGWH